MKLDILQIDDPGSNAMSHGNPVPDYAILIRRTHGPPPDLANLDDGDLVATADFRAVYSDYYREMTEQGMDEFKIVFLAIIALISPVSVSSV